MHALCAVGPPSRVAEYVLALRAAGVALPVALTPDAAVATVIALAQAGKRVLVEMDDVARLAGALAGVRRTAPQGLAEWRYTAGWSPASSMTRTW